MYIYIYNITNPFLLLEAFPIYLFSIPIGHRNSETLPTNKALDSIYQSGSVRTIDSNRINCGNVKKLTYRINAEEPRYFLLGRA